MRDREKLIELQRNANRAFSLDRFNCDHFGFVADHLISHGVTVRERGRWLYDSGSGKYFCSACDEEALSFKKDTLGYGELYEVCLTDFCPHCGADMRGEEDGRN